ncbi:MAG: threonine/serine exporter family protein [Coriobacteriia bacterium]|nr:threonine/serine exporter family protein [Coriobacteriia bacterium]
MVNKVKHTSVAKKSDTGSKIVDLALEIAYLQLISGAEMERVDRTIQKICDAYDATNVEYFTYPRFIILSLDYEGKTYTKSKKIRDKAPNFHRLEELSKVFDDILDSKPDLDIVIQRVRMLYTTKQFGVLAQMFCYFFGPAGFTIFFGGTFYEAAISGVIGLLILLITFGVKKLTDNFFFPTVIYSFVMSLSVRILGALAIVQNVESMQIGLLMMVVPGLIITNSMREFISGEYLTGYSKLIEALLVALAVAMGVIFAAALMRIFV